MRVAAAASRARARKVLALDRAPGRHFVDVDRKPRREQHQLRGNRRHHLPNDRADQSQIKARVRIRCFQAAKLQHARTGTLHVRLIRAVSGKLESKVSFDGSIELGRTVKVNVPSTVRQLTAANVIGELAYTLGISLIENMQIEDVVRFQGRVGLELAKPETLRGL